MGFSLTIQGSLYDAHTMGICKILTNILYKSQHRISTGVNPLSKQSPVIRAKTIITSHINADFDAIGAMLAAQLLYPEAVIIFPGSQEKNLRDFFVSSMSYLFN